MIRMHVGVPVINYSVSSGAKNIIYRSKGSVPGMPVVPDRDGGFIRQAGLQIFLILFLLQLCAASARMWRTIDTSWGFTLREDNSTCVYRNSIHALSAL